MDATRLPSLDLALSTFDHALDVVPKHRMVDLPALVRALTTFRHHPRLVDKRRLPAWSPARFLDGATRCSEAAVELSCLVLDLDDADVEVVHADWIDVLHILHTTWSHAPGTPRWRLVVPLARPVPACRWEMAWRWAFQRTSADQACRDPGRLYFLPAIADQEQPHDARVHVAPLLDLLDFAQVPEPRPERPPRRRICVAMRLRNAVIRRRFARDPATRERLAQSVGARLAGTGEQQRAEDVPCPSCGRPSVWFWLAPRMSTHARCQHQNSCGWSGPVDVLIDRSRP
jgi:hypothetical protein